MFTVDVTLNRRCSEKRCGLRPLTRVECEVNFITVNNLVIVLVVDSATGSRSMVIAI